MAFESNIPSGFVIQCSLEGRLIKIIHDQIGVSAAFAPGSSLSSIVDRENFRKMLNFLLDLRTHGMTSDWEINFPLSNQTIPIHLAGVVLDEHLLIFGAKNGMEVLHLYEELVKINNEQMNELRMLMKERADVVREQIKQDYVQYEEMTRLYNELANLQRELSKKNQELERLNQQKNHFLGMAAHDLRNPLSAIQMYSDFLLEELSQSLNEEHLEFLESIRSSSRFMLHLVDDFLDIAQIESGKLRLELWPVDLIAAVQSALSLMKALALKKQITLHFEPNSVKLAGMLIDASKMEQVFQNLISNAIKFSPPASTVSLQIRLTDTQVVLSVSDQGPGIPPAEIDRMFDPFERTSVRSSAGEKSSGLGLAIAKKIVMEHGGKLWVESEVGKGSAFYVALPRENIVES